MKKEKKQIVNKITLLGLGIVILGSILYYIYGKISSIIILEGILVILLGYFQQGEKSEKQKGNKYIIYGLGILFLGGFISDYTLYDDASSIILLVGIIFMLWGFGLRGAFDNLDSKDVRGIARLFIGKCPKCQRKIEYGTSKCPYCTADI